MLLRLLLLFTLVPLLELLLLLEIGDAIGLVPTLALVFGTGAAGAWMARREGMRSWNAVQAELAQGRVPGRELLHSLLILVAGAVLLTPGVLTDAAGLLLLVRPLRSRLIAGLRKHFEARVMGGAGYGPNGRVAFMMWGAEGPDVRRNRAGGEEGEDAVEIHRRGADGSRKDGSRDEDTRRPRVIEM